MDALVDLTLKSTALLAAGAFAIVLMRRASASSRHLVWTGLLCAIALLPISRLSLPALDVAVLASPVPEPAVPHFSPSALPQPALAATVPAVVVDNGATTPLPAPPPARITFSISEIVVAIWWLGFAALAFRAVAGYVVLRRLTACATVVSAPRVLAILREAAGGFRIRRRLSLLAHIHDGLPCTFGIVRPVILLPTSLLAGDVDGASRVRAVLIHETAHIARLDAISERITQVAVMLFWFNPLVWLAARQARFERERAADDAVLARGAKASEYASDLLSIAGVQSKTLWSSSVPMAASSLERRVRAILDNRISRGSHSRVSLAMTLVVFTAMLPVSAVRLVARSAAHEIEIGRKWPEPASVATTETPRPDRPSTASRSISMSVPVWGAKQSGSQPAPIPSQLPTPPLPTPVTPYTIGPDDVLVVTVWREKAFSGEMVVQPDGKVTLPGVGSDILAAGFTVDEFKVKVTEELKKKYLQQPDVSIAVKEIRSRKVYATGSQVPPASQKTDPAVGLAAWNAERLGMLKQVLERARAAWEAQLKRVQIGTGAPIDVVPLETTVAQLEQIVSAFTPSTTLPAPEQTQAVRAQFANALRNLDAAETRFNNGLLTSKELANALMAAKAPATGTVDAAASMFTTTNFPGSTEKDRNSARALYDLLTGRISSIVGRDMAAQGTLFLTDQALLDALRDAVNVASEVDRADALVTLAQKFALTPEMVAVYVTSANSIKDKAQRDRVFAQPIRVKSPDGKSQAYYWQRR